MTRFESFIIWGHGLTQQHQIMEMIQSDFEVVTTARKNFGDITGLIRQVYDAEMKTIPHHIMAKNKHLMHFPPEAVLVLVKNHINGSKPACSGHGPYNEICTNHVDHFKQVVRDIYNPKQSSGRRTEDHVIHGSDNDAQTESALKAFDLPPLYQWAISDCQHWTPGDFQKNKETNQGVPTAQELHVRHENLGLLQQAFTCFNVPFWLQGKTLLGLFRYNRLIIPDHDDDVGAHAGHRLKISTDIYSKLREYGFSAIRNDRWFLSVLRKNRYIDICFFDKRKDTTGYANKWFPQTLFERFDQLWFNDRFYPVPYRADELLSYMYPEKNTAAANSVKKPVMRAGNPQKLPYEAFLDCLIEADNSINWTLRAPHLNLVTGNGKRRKIRDIVAFFSDVENVKAVRQHSLQETDTRHCFQEPINLNNQFWQSGNNYFFNCILHGFRKNVIPYAHANRYITNGNGPMLYSGEYYMALERMSFDDIHRFLEKHPVTIENGAITHGQHRACAMIGLLAAGNPYIPLSIAA